MNLLILCFTVFTSLSVQVPLHDYYQECDLTASFSITKEPTRSRITLHVGGGSAPYKYLFYKKSGNLLSEDFDSNTVSVHENGKYFCTVIDKTNCKKTIEIEVK
jgi:hypothetical protein